MSKLDFYIIENRKIEKYTKVIQKKKFQNCQFFDKNVKKWMNESINREIIALDIENELHHFPDVRRKNQNGRDNTKHEEKPYFHCGPQTRKTIKST